MFSNRSQMTSKCGKNISDTFACGSLVTSLFLPHSDVICDLLLGTLRSNDTDGNENVKKTKGLISKTTTLHVHHAFLYISFLFLHDFDVKMLNLAF